MCYCETHDFTINRADEFMARRTHEARWYIVDPETLIRLIEGGLKRNELEIVFKNKTLSNGVESEDVQVKIRGEEYGEHIVDIKTLEA
jgi:hypothetical protein